MSAILDSSWALEPKPTSAWELNTGVDDIVNAAKVEHSLRDDDVLGPQLLGLLAEMFGPDGSELVDEVVVQHAVFVIDG